jgi:DNA polymerase I-like protein with 3'-5' exonuclease and polymerase domains
LIVKADAAALEWRVKAALANDKVAIAEILNKEDQHTANQKHFGLPSRLIAKIFVYRMIFADAFGESGFEGPAYAYANDPDFSGVSSSKKYWTQAIEKFFKKYEGMYNHSVNCIRTATRDGRITLPNGRFFLYEPRPNRRGLVEWPRPTILNYPVQGFGADIMREARLAYWEKLHTYSEDVLKGIFPMNTVHDDIQTDVVPEKRFLIPVRDSLLYGFEQVVPRLKKYYKYDLPVPMECEIKVGYNLYENSMKSLDSVLMEMV